MLPADLSQASAINVFTTQPCFSALATGARSTAVMSSTDRKALIALFEATDGHEWRVNRGWNTDCDISEWTGVAVDDRDRVVKLYLRCNSLRGKFSLSDT